MGLGHGGGLSECATRPLVCPCRQTRVLLGDPQHRLFGVVALDAPGKSAELHSTLPPEFEIIDHKGRHGLCRELSEQQAERFATRIRV